MFNHKMEAGTLLIRLALGVTFLVHGYIKFHGGIANTAGFFEKMGIPGILAYVVGGIELIGGLCVILGIGTRVVSCAFAGIMIGVITTAKASAGFAGGFEFEVALLVMSLHLLLAGSRTLSLDAVFARGKETKLDNRV